MTAFYVYCPKGVRTGGPEALHQLVDQLRSGGRSAYLLPTPGTEGHTLCEAYAQYDAPFIDEARMGPDDVLIAPEIRPDLLTGAGTGKRVLWWLSVDNSPLLGPGATLRECLLGNEPAGQGGTLREVVQKYRGSVAAIRRLAGVGIAHIAQSVYAQVAVRAAFDADAAIVSDYISGDFKAPIGVESRRPVVSYNPAKGAYLMDRLMSAMPDIDFVPLAGMTPDEVRAALGSCLVYVDLGHHPGKDRIPREAALAGAIVLTAARGAARHRLDMNLPPEFIVGGAGGDLVSHAATQLRHILAEPGRCYEMQGEYRSSLSGERDRFAREVEEFATAMETWGA